MIGWPSDDEARAAMRDKYERMIALRVAALAEQPRDGRAIRALAARYPGALRELDRAPLEVLRARLVALANPGVAWAAPTWIFHRQLRFVLEVRRAGGVARSLDRARPVFLREADLLGFGPDELETLMNPPSGRLSRWLLVRLAEHLDTSVVELEGVLFGHLAKPGAGHVRPGW